MKIDQIQGLKCMNFKLISQYGEEFLSLIKIESYENYGKLVYLHKIIKYGRNVIRVTILTDLYQQLRYLEQPCFFSMF